MKSLQDILKECDLVTPGNTMGMGNPMPPTDNAPGSEPICSDCKKGKKKKKVKESLLDTGNDIEKFDEGLIRHWINIHAQEDAANIQINDDLTLNTRFATIFLEENEQIPEYIRFKQAHSLAIWGEIAGDPIKIHKDLLPSSMKRFNINAGGVEFDNKLKSSIDELTIAHARSIILSKKMTIGGKLNLSNCDKLENLENIQGIKYINIPNAYAAKLFRKTYNYKGDLSMNGFGPY